SVGEAMAIGRTFKEALMKGFRSLEVGANGIMDDRHPEGPQDLEIIRQKLIIPNKDRVFFIRYALRAGIDVEEIHALTRIDPWFLKNIEEIVKFESELEAYKSDLPIFSGNGEIPEELIRRAKRYGYADKQIGAFMGLSESEMRRWRVERGIESVFKLVDTC